MSRPLVSIITPCFRQAHFLARTLESALEQSYAPLEIIVVNDGSDDDTEQVARRFGDAIRYLWQPNAGLPGARNTGIAAATGKYLLFLDSDDLLHRDAVMWLVDAAAGREDRLCLMGYRFFEQDTDLHSGRTVWPREREPLGLSLMSGNPGPPHCYLCPRQPLAAIGGFDRTLRSCEDWDTWARLVIAGVDIVAVNRIGAHYRQHGASMSKNTLRMTETACEVARRNLQRITEHPDRIAALGGTPRNVAKDVRARMARDCFDAGYFLRNQGRYSQAVTYFLQAWREAHDGKALAALAKLPLHGFMRTWQRFCNREVEAELSKAV